MKTARQEQKKLSRDRNQITTMQLSKVMKARLKRIQKFSKLSKQDEALDEVLCAFEDNHPDILKMELDHD